MTDDSSNTAVLARRLPLAFVAAAADADAADAAVAAPRRLAVQPAASARSGGGGGRAALQLVVLQEGDDSDQHLLGSVPISFPASALAGEGSATTPNKKRRRPGSAGGGGGGGASSSLSEAELAAARAPSHPLLRALYGLLLAGEARVEVEVQEEDDLLTTETFADGSAAVRALCRVRLLHRVWWRAPPRPATADENNASSAAWAAGEPPGSARDRAAYALSPRADHVNALLVGLVLLAEGRPKEEQQHLPRLAELDDPDRAAGPFAAAGRSLREEVLAMARQPRGGRQQADQAGDKEQQVWTRSLGPGRPRGLACALYGYQRRCVAWMAWREQGGFLSAGSAGATAATAARAGEIGGGASSSSSPSSSPGLLGLGLLNPLWRALVLPAFWDLEREKEEEGDRLAPAAVRRAAERQERALASSSSSSQPPPVLIYHCAAFGLLSLRMPPPLASVLGGCLCDEVGVGKTVEVIALALLRPPPSPRLPPPLPPPPPSAESPPQPQQPPGLFGGTLVVCPPALLSQWHAEVRRHAPGLRVAVYEGLAFYRQQRELEQERQAVRRAAATATATATGSAPATTTTAAPPPPPVVSIAFPRGTSQAERRRAKEAMAQWDYLLQGPPDLPRYDAEQEAREAAERVSLANADVVLTAFPVLNREADLDASAQRGTLRRAKRYAVPDSPLIAIRWWRVVVDEAQMVPNSANAAVARVCERLRAPHRWCVTGTPVTDAGIGDVHAMLRVLRVAPVGVAAAADGGAAAEAAAATTTTTTITTTTTTTTTTDAHLAEAVFEAAIARPYREWTSAAAAAAAAGNDAAGDHDGGDGRRRLAALLRPLAWRHTRADASADHPLPPRRFAVAKLRLSPAERSVYDHILARTVAASEAWAAAVAAGAGAGGGGGSDGGAGGAAGPSSPPPPPPPPPPRGAKRGRGGAASTNTTTNVQRSLDLAAGELLQLRLACIHPQLTLYWRQLSAEVQGLGGGGNGQGGGGEGGDNDAGEEGAAHGTSSSVVSIGQILRRLRDGAQLRLQAKERELCAALNALAAKLTRRAEEQEGGGVGAAKAGGKGKAAKENNNNTSPTDLRAEALALLQQSYAVGEHGIAALDKKQAGGGGGGGGGDNTNADAEDDEPLGDIAGAEATWRAWQYQQLHTLGALCRAHEHAARAAAAGKSDDDNDNATAAAAAAEETRRSAERVTKGLLEPAVAARDRASATAASLRAAVEASERELRESWREAVRLGGDPAAALMRGGVPSNDLLDAAVAEAVAAAEVTGGQGEEDAAAQEQQQKAATITTPTPPSSLELRRRCAEAARRARAAADDANSATSGGSSAEPWLAFCAAALEAAQLAEEADRREQQEQEQQRRRGKGGSSSSAAALALASSLGGGGGSGNHNPTTVVLLGKRVREVAERLEAAANPARQALEGEQARRLARAALDALAAGKRGFDAAVGVGAATATTTPTTIMMPYDCPPERAALMRALFQHAAFGGEGHDPDNSNSSTACEQDGRACALAARLAPDGLASAEALRRTLQQASRALQRRLPQWQSHGLPAQALPQPAVDAGSRASKLRAKLPRRRYDSYRASLAAEAAEDALSAAAAAASAAFEGDGDAAAAAALAAAVEDDEDGGGGRGGGGGRTNNNKRRRADASSSSSTATKTEAELRVHAEALQSRCRELLSQRRFLRNQVLSAERQAAAVERAAAEARAAERRRREAAARAAEARQQVAVVVAAEAEAEVEGAAAGDADDDQADNECPVCRSSGNEQSEAVVFACGHFLCVACAEALLGSSSGNDCACAVCRQPISRATSFRVAMRRTRPTGFGAANAAQQQPPGTAAAVAAAEAAAEAAEAAAAEAEAEAAAALLRGDPAAIAAEAGDPDAEGYVSGGDEDEEDQDDQDDHDHKGGLRTQTQRPDNDADNANDDPSENPLPKAKSLLRVRVRGPHGAWLTKVCALVRRLAWLRDHRPQVKSLVFSQFPDALLIVSRALSANGIRHACIGVGGSGAGGEGAGGGSGRRAGRGRGRGRPSGGGGGAGRSAAVAGGAEAAAAAAAGGATTTTAPTTPTTADAGAGAVGRSARLAVRSFAEDDGVKVMLLSLRAGGQGLTLTRASRVFLLEPSPDPSVDEQAVARVYRIGQERKVVVTRLLVEGTVEQGVAALCARKGGVGYGYGGGAAGGAGGGGAGGGGRGGGGGAPSPGDDADDDQAAAAPAVRHEHLDAADVEGLLRAAVGGGGGAGTSDQAPA